MVLTASLLRAQQNREGVENKPASLLVVSLGKALNGTPPSLCGWHTGGGAKQSVRRDGPRLTEDLQTEKTELTQRVRLSTQCS